MDDVLHADAVDDDTVRVELDGETHDLSVAVAEQLSQDLDAAIETLRSDQDEDADDGDADYDPTRSSSRSSPAWKASARLSGKGWGSGKGWVGRRSF